MVKEGHDSTHRPTLKTYSFDNGRPFLDQWKADGKPMWSRRVLGRFNALAVLASAAAAPMLLFSDWGEEETVISPVQRGVRDWWQTFVALDKGDVAKARSVGAWRVIRERHEAPPEDSFWTLKGKKRVRPESDAEAARIAFGNIAVSKEYVELKSES